MWVRYAGLKIAAAVAVAACLSLLLRAERECTASLPPSAGATLALSAFRLPNRLSHLHQTPPISLSLYSAHATRIACVLMLPS